MGTPRLRIILAHLLIVVALSTLCFSVVLGQSNDPAFTDHFFVRQMGIHQLELWRLHTDGSTAFIAVLEDLIASISPEGNWDIMVPADISPSPDGQQVAFTAVDRTDRQFALFLIEISPLRILQFDAPGLAAIAWSPTGDAVLLRRPSVFIGGELDPLGNGDTYVFDVRTLTFTQIGDTNETQTVFDSMWLPDGDNLILEVQSPFNTEELLTPDLYAVSRDGSNLRRLTHLAVEAVQAVDFTKPRTRDFCDISHMRWSASSARIYYVLRCMTSSDVWAVSVFSVDLDGNNRLETDFYTSFPEQFNPEFAPPGHEVFGLFAVDNTTYLFVNASGYDQHGVPTIALYVLRVTAPQQVEIVQNLGDTGGMFATLSGDSNSLAFTDDYDRVYVLNLHTNTLQVLDLTTETYMDCTIRWLNAETLLIDQVDLCGRRNTQFIAVQRIIAWNIETNAAEPIDWSEEGNFNFVLSAPQQ